MDEDVRVEGLEDVFRHEGVIDGGVLVLAEMPQLGLADIHPGGGEGGADSKRRGWFVRWIEGRKKVVIRGGVPGAKVRLLMRNVTSGPELVF